MYFFIETFGEVESGNIFVKRNLFIPIADIYFRNKYKFSENTLKQMFFNLINKQQIISDSFILSREGMILARKHMLEYMNKGRKTKFVK